MLLRFGQPSMVFRTIPDCPSACGNSLFFQAVDIDEPGVDLDGFGVDFNEFRIDFCCFGIAFGGYGTDEKSTCEVAEFIMVGSEISDSDRQKLEGYIAHKWGLAAILPSTHPYNNLGP